MHVEIDPEPTPEEREALLGALAAADAGPDGSCWWEAGVREAVEEDAEQPLP